MTDDELKALFGRVWQRGMDAGVMWASSQTLRGSDATIDAMASRAASLEMAIAEFRAREASAPPGLDMNCYFCGALPDEPHTVTCLG